MRFILAITKYRADLAVSLAVIAWVTAVGGRYVEITCIGGKVQEASELLSKRNCFTAPA